MTGPEIEPAVATQHTDSALDLAEQYAQHLVSLDVLATEGLPYGRHPQSLAHGAAGIALLHVERAARGLGSWSIAHRWIAAAATGEISSGKNAGAFHGAPGLAFVLRVAANARPGPEGHALKTLEHATDEVVRSRIAAATDRRRCGEPAQLAEFDTLRGLAGMGMILIHRDPGSDLVRELLACLVALARPVQDGDDLLPGWWTRTGPNGSPSERFPGGHANTGLAHGIAGPISLLSHAALYGICVEGQVEAIEVMCGWLDQWQQNGETGPWWPHWITRQELHSHSTSQAGPWRPSWCYGTAGVARAQQLAALALGDRERQAMAELALVAAISDPAQLAETKDASLCHGFAGLAHVATRAAADAVNPDIRKLTPDLLDRIATTAEAGPGRNPDLLNGLAGTALALYALASPAATSWDQVFAIG
jgi:hypothetical protein